MREAAVMVIINNEGEILGISRRKDKTKFGLPGGKKDDTDNTTADTAIRETKEETGVDVHSCVFLYKREESPAETGGEWFYTYCYLALSWSGEPKNSEEGEVKWLTTTELTDPNSAFPIYNTKTFAKLREKYPALLLK